MSKQFIYLQCSRKTFRNHQTKCPMGSLKYIRKCQLCHRTFGSNHRKCPTCPTIFLNTAHFLPCSRDRIFTKLAPDIHLMKCLWHVQFGSKRSKYKVTNFFLVSALWLCACFTKSLYFWQNCCSWGGDVSRTILRSKGQRSRSHGSFKVKVMLIF